MSDINNGLSGYELLAQARSAIDNADKALGIARDFIHRQELLLDQTRELLQRLSTHCPRDRFSPGAMGSGLSQRFIGCSIYQKHAPDEYCLACEAQVLLEEFDKNSLKIKE